MNHAALAVAIASFLVFGLGIVLPIVLGRASHAAMFHQRLTPLDMPTVDVVVPAFLEVGEMAGKIRDLRSSLKTYDGISTITVMASDSATADAAREAGADVVLMGERRGKATAMNEAILQSTSDVVVVTDANCRIEPTTWPATAISTLRDFALVSSNKVEPSSAEGLYWAMEKRIKGSSTSPRPTLSVVGEFLAFRREDFQAFPSSTRLDDAWLAIDFARRDLIPTVDPKIWTVETPASRADQWDRRLRNCEGVLEETLPRLGELSRTQLGRRLLAHKVYRMTIGNLAFWTGMLASCFVLPPYSTVLVVGVTAIAIAWYSGAATLPLPFSTFFTAVGMQGVPPATAFRRLRRRGRMPAGWKKIAR